MTLRRSAIGLPCLAGVLLVLGCASDNSAGDIPSEGGAGAGDTAGSAGVSGTGGLAAAGGQGQAGSRSGGATSAGGASSSGGTAAGDGGSPNSAGGASGSGGAGGTGGRRGRGGAGGTASGGAASGGTTGTGGAGNGGAGGSNTSSTGWLHTTGNKIYQTSGGTDTVWVGRGVNMTDLYVCGRNNQLTDKTVEQSLKTEITFLATQWKATFIRISLAMDSYNGVVGSFLTNPSQYKTPMVNVINSVGNHPGVYALVTLRSDASMIDQANSDDPEATGLPSDATTTPNKSKFPTGTDPVYVAMVDAFANESFVMFGITNEPATLNDGPLAAVMSHAVDVIRAEEDKLGVTHHLVAVQGGSWTGDISYYDSHPLTQDNVVYEVHGYPPASNAYTYTHIPVIIGEYGSLGNANSFYSDLESKQIPSLAWIFNPLSPCPPDLLNETDDASNISPNSWGNTVKNYLTAH